MEFTSKNNELFSSVMILTYFVDLLSEIKAATSKEAGSTCFFFCQESFVLDYQDFMTGDMVKIKSKRRITTTAKRRKISPVFTS